MTHESPRLILRPWEEHDRALFAAIVADPDVMRFYPSTRTRVEADAWVDRMVSRYADGTSNFMAVERKSDGALMGMLGTAEITFHIPTDPRLEIGWLLGKQYWGEGYAPEGALVMLAYAFDTLHAPEVVAFTSRLNTPSQRVMEKLRMVRDPSADFEHPNVPPGNPLRPHVLYRIPNPNRP